MKKLKNAQILDKKAQKNITGGRPPWMDDCPRGYHACEPGLCVRDNQGCP